MLQPKCEDIKISNHSKSLLKNYYERYPKRKDPISKSKHVGHFQAHWTHKIQNIWTNHLLKSKGSDYDRIRKVYERIHIPGISTSLIMKHVSNLYEQLKFKHDRQLDFAHSYKYLCNEHITYISEESECMKPSYIISMELHDVELELSECICPDITSPHRFRCIHCIFNMNKGENECDHIANQLGKLQL